MKLHPPFVITSRLLPGLHLRDVANRLSELSITFNGQTSDGRTRYRYYLDTPAFEFTNNDLMSGVGGGSLQDGMISLLSFLTACAESVDCKSRTGRDGENFDLFPLSVAKWASDHKDALTFLEIEIQENGKNLIHPSPDVP